jgi:hypothetical protein
VSGGAGIKRQIHTTSGLVVNRKQVQHLLRLISEDTIARILFTQGNQQGLHLSAVSLNN